MNDLEEGFKQVKMQNFRTGLAKLEEETGMTVVAVMKPTIQALTATLEIVPLQKVNKEDVKAE